MKHRKIGKPLGIDDKLMNTVACVLTFLVLAVTLYPLIFVASASFSDPKQVIAGNVLLLPRGLTLDGYKLILEYKSIWVGYRNTLFYTVFGTALNMFVTIPCAYSLSRKDFKGRGAITMLFTFTMFFSGGMIPTYLAMKSLNLLNTVWAVLVPGLMSMGNLIIARTYFSSSVPWELQEAALIDGCSDAGLLLRMVIPLSFPMLAVLTLYYMVGHWNAYFSALIYLTDEKLFPLQVFLRNILIMDQTGDILSGDPEALQEAVRRMELKESMKYGLVVVSSLPVLMLYPFLQRFFVKGVMMGAIKG